MFTVVTNGDKMSKKVAQDFWRNTEKYPDFGNIKQRRLHEINYLVPKLSGKTVLDLGCGDGALLNCLINLVEFDEIHGFDISNNLLKNLHPSIKKKVFDFYNYNELELPAVEDTILAGSVQYVFDDSVILKLFSDLKTEKIFVRATCTLTKERIIIDSFSGTLNDQYSCVYRTVPDIIELLQDCYKIERVDRIYPDEIESKFGTKQFYFVGLKK
jgi:SAM-dependent methyltransferase